MLFQFFVCGVESAGSPPQSKEHARLKMNRTQKDTPVILVLFLSENTACTIT